MRITSIILTVMLMAGCNRQSSAPTSVALNTVESVDSREVILGGEPWAEVTISQRVDPKAPTYVVGIRKDKWANRLRWAMIEQRIDAERVITRFRLRPIGQPNEITLNRDDFDWYPRISGFEPVEVVLKAEPGGAANGSQSICSETDSTSLAAGSRRRSPREP